MTYVTCLLLWSLGQLLGVWLRLQRLLGGREGTGLPAVLALLAGQLLPAVRLR